MTARRTAFGFCDFSGPEAALRALRVLKDMHVGDKQLKVGVNDRLEKTAIVYLIAISLSR